MALRRISLILFFASWMPSVPLVLAQGAPDYKPLVGVWTWRPTRDWSAVLTIQSVTDAGLVTALWQDPTYGTIPFTTLARMEEGKLKIAFGRSTRFNPGDAPRAADTAAVFGSRPVRGAAPGRGVFDPVSADRRSGRPTGFARTARTPSNDACRCRSASVSPVVTTTRMVGSNLTIRFNASIPPSLGIARSRMIAWGR